MRLTSIAAAARLRSGLRQTARHVCGQAIIWLLGTLAACAAVTYAVFNTNQVIVGKQRAVNAADAGALAGAQAQARLLNLIAYSNRAQTANDAFLGQMLGLESWLLYAEQTASNVADVMSVLKFIPPWPPSLRWSKSR